MEPSREGKLPPTSVFFASGRFVLSHLVLGSTEPDMRENPYRKIVDILLDRAITLGMGELRVKHTRLSADILGSRFPPYSLSRPPKGLEIMTSFADILAEQEELYTKLEHRDRLKLISQATYGPVHLFSDSEKACQDFMKEWEGLAGPSESPLAELISPNGDLYRINLAPARELKLNPEKLFQAVERSAEMFQKDVAARKKRFLPQIEALGIKPGDVPSMPPHHSESYTKTIHPSYRLISSAELCSLLRD